MSAIRYLRIYADADGVSHFETLDAPLETNDYAPPATPLSTTALLPANACIFLELPVGWFGDWHPTPVRQWLIIMSGELEFEVADGERRQQQAGDAVMLYDTIGQGHRTRVTGDQPVRIAAIHFT